MFTLVDYNLYCLRVCRKSVGITIGKDGKTYVVCSVKKRRTHNVGTKKAL
jgi:hypothetical protein